MKYFILAGLLSGAVFANSNDLIHRPKSFPVTGGQAVFVDFSEAVYKITYDATTKKALVRAEISFDAPEAGLPIFDTVQTPTSIILDGVKVDAVEAKTPSRETTLRYVNRSVSVGSHSMIIEVPLNELLDFTSEQGVKSAFWTSDLSEREFMERYLPANFEFDQVKMTYMIKFVGTKTKQLIFTNGTQTTEGDWIKISYPSHYTASSIFFHTVPEGTVEYKRFTLRSIDGREIPAVVYYQNGPFSTTNLDRLQQKTTDVFTELERDYGAFLHPQIIVYNAGSGGMEYCGATMTDNGALGHELFHSYFARGVMPANGNSGWMDEALASWRDGGYRSTTTLSGSSRMSAHEYYTRTTDTAAYSFGARFMGYLDGTLAARGKGGLKPFMRHMVENKSLKPIFVEEFYKEMSAFYGVDMEPDFKKYTYGQGIVTPAKADEHVHKKMSLQELRKHL